jgi:hypothetical protein
MTWWQVEEPIIAHKMINCTREEFELWYGLDTDGGQVKGANALQFAQAVVDAKPITDKMGEINETKTDVDGTETDVLMWNITNCKAYSIFKTSKSLSTWVRYSKRPGVTVPSVKVDGKTQARPKSFYVKFTWEPKEINITPTSEFGDGNKIKQYWYADNNALAGTGYENIHGNVEVVGTAIDASLQPDLASAVTSLPADDEYIFDIKSTLVGNKFSIDALKAPYNNLKLGTDYKVKMFFVDGGSATGYSKLYANAKGTELHTVAIGLQTAQTLIATIDPETGVVYYGSANGQPASATAKSEQLLNAVSHSDLVNSVTACVGVKAILCEGACTEREIVIANNTFLVKFLRPISITSATVNFEDAETNGSDAPVKMTFVDWRDHNFGDTSKTKGQDYFAYYGVKNIVVDIDNATTDLNGGNAKLSTVTKQMKFSYTAPAAISLNNYGTIHYENNGTTVGVFHVTFPATIEYDWGKVPFTIVATVGKTQANARKK